MSQIKVLAYFNINKFQFSIEALEGEDKGKVIAYEREIILTDCKFTSNKGKTACVLGNWDSTASSMMHIDSEICRYFGIEAKKYVEEEEWSPIFASEDIKYDVDSKQYIINDDSDFWDLDEDVQREIKNDKDFKKPALDNAGLIYLEIDADDFDDISNPDQYASEEPPDTRDFFDSNTIKGFACYWRQKT